MGLSSHPTPSEGVLSVILVNTALSVAIFKGIFMYILRIVGLELQSEPGSNDDVDHFPYSGTTICLEPLADDIRHRIPVVLFESMGYPQPDIECAVCLTSFQPESEVSQLSCSHFFHKPCLDKWLNYWRSTCPLCRCSLLPQETAW